MHYVQDVCYATDKVSSILTPTSVASLLPFLLPLITSESSVYNIQRRTEGQSLDPFWHR